jgi:hypothetical protein
MKRMKTPHHFQKVIAVLRKYMAVLSMTMKEHTSKQGGVPDDSIWLGYHSSTFANPTTTTLVATHFPVK